jgi:hypothetical protein
MEKETVQIREKAFKVKTQRERRKLKKKKEI